MRVIFNSINDKISLLNSPPIRTQQNSEMSNTPQKVKLEFESEQKVIQSSISSIHPSVELQK